MKNNLKNNLFKKIVIITLIFSINLGFSANIFAYENTSTGSNIQKEGIRKKRLYEINNTKEIFEKSKQEIIEKLKNGEISKKEAKNKIIDIKEKVVIEAKKRLEEEKTKLKNENINRLRTIIREKLDQKLIKIRRLTIEEKIIFFTKLIEKLDTELNKTNISSNNKLILNIIKDIITKRKNRLN